MTIESRIRVARGPRAVEALLLAELARRADEVRARPGLLARPVRVVVPSRSLAQHVSRALVRHVGRGVAGIRVQTLHGLALEILETAGVEAPRGDDLFGVLVRRCAREEPELRRVLDALEDGYGAVAGAVADLLDAGFAHDVDVHGEAVAEALAESGLPQATRERVAAVARVARATGAGLAALGLGRRGTRLAAAADRLGRDPLLLPARAILIHGFADATGVASDLLELLMRHEAALALIDHPADPARPDERDLGAAFTDRLLARLAPGAAASAAPAPPAPPALAGLRAAGTDAEVRAVADRIHALLEEGAEPEAIGVVARDLGRYAVALRTQLGRLGIPFSGQSASGPPSGRSRRVHALLDLLSLGGATPAERWLEVYGGIGRGRRADLRLGFHAEGAARLADVAALDADALLGGRQGLPLPARVGLARAREGEEGAVGPRARRRQLAGDALREALDRASALCAHLEGWPERAPLSVHLARLATLLDRHLAWGRGAAERHDVEAAAVALRGEVPDLELGFEELVLLLRRLLRGAGADRLGGAGAGVQVLSVVEARARTFEHLFVLGVNRDVFPRPLVEDPLLPDAVRRPLEVVLPEIPVKARGFEEEHYLFAQLLAASPRVTLSWQVADDEGKARAPSPFVERLRGDAVALAVEDAPTLQAPPGRAAGRPRTAAEAAVGEALYGDRRRFAELLPVVVEECARFGTGPDSPGAAAALAAGRMAVLRELGEAPAAGRLGPYFGFVGPARLANDLRRKPLFVTHLEGLARCPWEFFLKRLLGLEPPPNALDSLPDASPLLIGNVVHTVLERIVAEGREDAGGLAELAGASVVWPEAERLEALLDETAAALLEAEGIGPASFRRVVVEAARPLVEAARRLDWPGPGGDVRCVGAELEAEVGVAGRTIRFRADRADRVPAGMRYVDYKTGKRTPSGVRDPRGKLLEGVATGRYLQAPAYALSSGGEGRYLFLHPDAAVPIYTVEGDAADFRRAFQAAVETLLAAFDSGAFFPRLSELGDTGPHRNCEYCEVREACLQGDAGARGRLATWAAAGKAPSGAEAAALELWRLPGRTPK